VSKNKVLFDQIGRYIKGKDANKPHLFESVFSQDAVLKMMVQSDNISFPEEVNGLDAITKTLSSEFNLAYENIYTLCFLDTFKQSENLINCHWLVGMTSKETGEVKVGYGDYHWTFELEGEHKVSKLIILIEDMLVLPKEQSSYILNWLESGTYPWAMTSATLETMPDIEGLSGAAEFLGKLR